MPNPFLKSFKQSTMKKIFLLLPLLFAMCTTFAQLTDARVSKDTAVNADTVYITYQGTKSHVNAIQATVTKVSGTVGGKIYLWGTVDGSNWVVLDSSSALSNVAVNSKIFSFDRSKGTQYTSYRVELRSSGTQSSTLRATMLRRPDE